LAQWVDKHNLKILVCEYGTGVIGDGIRDDRTTGTFNKFLEKRYTGADNFGDLLFVTVHLQMCNQTHWFQADPDSVTIEHSLEMRNVFLVIWRADECAG
jgi:hypothetical protein